MKEPILSLIVFLSFGLLLIVLEILSRKFKWQSEVMRRVSHMFGAVVAAISSYFLTFNSLLVVLGVFVLVMFLSRILKIFQHIHKVSRKTFGEELLPLGFIAAYLISGGDSRIFIPSVLIVGLADPLTGIVMQKFKKHTLGIIVFIIVSIPILMLFSHATILTAIVIAICVSIVERISPYGIDNFSVPVTVALLLLYI